MFNPNRYSLEPMINGLNETLDSVFKVDVPKLDVYYDDAFITIEAEVPGIPKENISIDTDDNQIIINGKYPKKENEVNYIHRQRLLKDFSKTITLDINFDVNLAVATVQDGILTIKLPRVYVNKTKKINIE